MCSLGGTVIPDPGMIQDPFAASIRQYRMMDLSTTITLITFGGTALILNTLMAVAYWVAR
ncbi:hypothetical protein HHTV1_43 [Haloarcula hispanica tailed virus 1]|uniref:Uncharacterized protein n=1 Tax=Haloarcula hispanica tailed virus 1 TaxID=1273750 RepID=R4TKU6_9CAUD|nr:hypothetical protein M198_gp43 [Haloarcula hispanica tailed virus 1]AGM11297.1 hypothetical protein HHTV1_43 [Haloarcula hispanica tailed virus 1]